MNERPEDSDSKLPLHDEALAREKWRGGETLLKGDEGGLGLPASETDNARAAWSSDDDEDGRPGRGRPGDFPPPD